jgi:hypothetical protein
MATSEVANIYNFAIRAPDPDAGQDHARVARISRTWWQESAAATVVFELLQYFLQLGYTSLELGTIIAYCFVDTRGLKGNFPNFIE